MNGGTPPHSRMNAVLRLDTLTPATLESLFAEFLAEGAARLDRDGVPAADRRMLRSVDLRYHGQSFELPIAVPPGALTPSTSRGSARSSTRRTSGRMATRPRRTRSSW